MTTTLDAADDFDHSDPRSDAAKRARCNRIASFARSHCGIRAHVTKLGTVLLADRSGSIATVRTMRACAEWLGY